LLYLRTVRELPLLMKRSLLMTLQVLHILNDPTL
jgi:hypothetical protein